ncbi:hypothetical protein B0H11DRAFT_2082508 [Mycena galericulata]|nr:hypothetical protein B0H11DRAFT_2082508 [Mycena galericulata]
MSVSNSIELRDMHPSATGAITRNVLAHIEDNTLESDNVSPEPNPEAPSRAEQRPLITTCELYSYWKFVYSKPPIGGWPVAENHPWARAKKPLITPGRVLDSVLCLVFRVSKTLLTVLRESRGLQNRNDAPGRIELGTDLIDEQVNGLPPDGNHPSRAERKPLIMPGRVLDSVLYWVFRVLADFVTVLDGVPPEVYLGDYPYRADGRAIITPWRVLNSVLILGGGAYKAIATYMGQTVGPTTADWIVGVLWALIAYWVSFFDDSTARSWFFAFDMSRVVFVGVMNLVVFALVTGPAMISCVIAKNADPDVLVLRGNGAAIVLVVLLQQFLPLRKSLGLFDASDWSIGLEVIAVGLLLQEHVSRIFSGSLLSAESGFYRCSAEETESIVLSVITRVLLLITAGLLRSAKRRSTRRAPPLHPSYMVGMDE